MWFILRPTRSSISSAASALPQVCSLRAIFRATWCCCRSNLSGNTSNALEASAKETNVVVCRVADPSVCTVIAGGREYARAVLPLFEFGRTINVALPRRK